ncbi:cysteine desulfurase family protein [Providencia sp. PROV197]|uniref:cysteine desulfurase family protein n=1 Tax=Providencia TaxID=586 RepID=UPI0023493516|nr:cysteine desulfurase family protein [Providencia sp. PROV197]
MPSLYFDFNASTPIHPEVQASMQPLLNSLYGNPSSQHWASDNAKSRLEHARAQVASLIGAHTDEIIFTSGGTESNNLALKGHFFNQLSRHPNPHIITQITEHPSILSPLAFLEKLGATVTYLPVDQFGRVSPLDVSNAITPNTTFISIMHANNETGTIQPIEEIGYIAKQNNICFHTDAAQSIGKVTIDVNQLNVDLLSIAGHKVYAPKGIGALYVRRGTMLEPINHGAGHENGLRAGTESLLLATALGLACEIAQTQNKNADIRQLRDNFWQQLVDLYGDQVLLNGHETHRLPNTLNVGFKHQQGADLLGKLSGVAASTGSACHEGQATLSPVLSAMNVDSSYGLGAIRFSLGLGVTQQDINLVIQKLKHILPSN